MPHDRPADHRAAWCEAHPDLIDALISMRYLFVPVETAADLRAIAEDLANVQAATFLDDRIVNGAIDRLRAVADKIEGEAEPS